jgi:DNA-binding NarL/FixJ family response regulator
MKPKLSQIASPDEEAKIARLTGQERVIIKLICQGLKDRQIAKRLFRNTTSVRDHIVSILSKLGVSDRFELIIYAYMNGLAVPPGEGDSQEKEGVMRRAYGESA